ncbi:MAG: type I methionyl aminopeptidase [Patescibacteria group bacterium]
MIARSEIEIEILKEGGQILARILSRTAELVAPGVSTLELNKFAEEQIGISRAASSFEGYRDPGSGRIYPASLCVSINDEIVHGLPGKRQIKEGDAVSLDLGIKHKGLFTDAAVTVVAGKSSPQNKKLVSVCKNSLAAGIKKCRAGAAVGDVGYAIESFAKSQGFVVIKELVGHGVGRKVHEEPQIPNWGRQGQGYRFKAGEVVALEPMITSGRPEIILAFDGWTWKTKDGSWTAHFEHTIIILEKGAEILTELG